MKKETIERVLAIQEDKKALKDLVDDFEYEHTCCGGYCGSSYTHMLAKVIKHITRRIPGIKDQFKAQLAALEEEERSL